MAGKVTHHSPVSRRLFIKSSLLLTFLTLSLISVVSGRPKAQFQPYPDGVNIKAKTGNGSSFFETGQGNLAESAASRGADGTLLALGADGSSSAASLEQIQEVQSRLAEAEAEGLYSMKYFDHPAYAQEEATYSNPVVPVIPVLVDGQTFYVPKIIVESQVASTLASTSGYGYATAPPPPATPTPSPPPPPPAKDHLKADKDQALLAKLGLAQPTGGFQVLSSTGEVLGSTPAARGLLEDKVDKVTSASPPPPPPPPPAPPVTSDYNYYQSQAGQAASLAEYGTSGYTQPLYSSPAPVYVNAVPAYPEYPSAPAYVKVVVPVYAGPAPAPYGKPTGSAAYRRPAAASPAPQNYYGPSVAYPARSPAYPTYPTASESYRKPAATPSAVASGYRPSPGYSAAPSGYSGPSSPAYRPSVAYSPAPAPSAAYPTYGGYASQPQTSNTYGAYPSASYAGVSPQMEPIYIVEEVVPAGVYGAESSYPAYSGSYYNSASPSVYSGGASSAYSSAPAAETYPTYGGYSLEPQTSGAYGAYPSASYAGASPQMQPIYIVEESIPVGAYPAYTPSYPTSSGSYNKPSEGYYAATPSAYSGASSGSSYSPSAAYSSVYTGPEVYPTSGGYASASLTSGAYGTSPSASYGAPGAYSPMQPIYIVEESIPVGGAYPPAYAPSYPTSLASFKPSSAYSGASSGSSYGPPSAPYSSASAPEIYPSYGGYSSVSPTSGTYGASLPALPVYIIEESIPAFSPLPSAYSPVQGAYSGSSYNPRVETVSAYSPVQGVYSGSSYNPRVEAVEKPGYAYQGASSGSLLAYTSLEAPAPCYGTKLAVAENSYLTSSGTSYLPAYYPSQESPAYLVEYGASSAYPQTLYSSPASNYAKPAPTSSAGPARVLERYQPSSAPYSPAGAYPASSGNYGPSRGYSTAPSAYTGPSSAATYSPSLTYSSAPSAYPTYGAYPSASYGAAGVNPQQPIYIIEEIIPASQAFAYSQAQGANSGSFYKPRLDIAGKPGYGYQGVSSGPSYSSYGGQYTASSPTYGTTAENSYLTSTTSGYGYATAPPPPPPTPAPPPPPPAKDKDKLLLKADKDQLLLSQLGLAPPATGFQVLSSTGQVLRSTPDTDPSTRNLADKTPAAPAPPAPAPPADDYSYLSSLMLSQYGYSKPSPPPPPPAPAPPAKDKTLLKADKDQLLLSKLGLAQPTTGFQVLSSTGQVLGSTPATRGLVDDKTLVAPPPASPPTVAPPVYTPAYQGASGVPSTYNGYTSPPPPPTPPPPPPPAPLAKDKTLLKADKDQALLAKLGLAQPTGGFQVLSSTGQVLGSTPPATRGLLEDKVDKVASASPPPPPPPAPPVTPDYNYYQSQAGQAALLAKYGAYAQYAKALQATSAGYQPNSAGAYSPAYSGTSGTYGPTSASSYSPSIAYSSAPSAYSAAPSGAYPTYGGYSSVVVPPQSLRTYGARVNPQQPIYIVEEIIPVYSPPLAPAYSQVQGRNYA